MSIQRFFVLPARQRGCYLITNQVVKEIEKDHTNFECGLAQLLLQHTSASLTFNDNYENDVLADTQIFLSTIVTEGERSTWRYTTDPDDTPAH